MVDKPLIIWRKNVLHYNQRTFGGWCSFRSSNQTLEPKDEKVHLWCEEWHLYH